MPASVEPAQLGMPVPLSRPSRVSALLVHIVYLARRCVPTAPPATRAHRHQDHHLLLQPCVLLGRSASLVTRRARTVPPLLALSVAPDQRRPLGHCVRRASSVSEAQWCVVTAVQGTHALPGQHRRLLLQRYVLLVALVLLAQHRARTAVLAMRAPPRRTLRRQLTRCVLLAASASLARRRVPTAAPATHAPPGRRRRRLRRRYVLLVGLVRPERRRAATVDRCRCLGTSVSLALVRAVASPVRLAPSVLVPG
jgi:hypothetical protein